MKKKIICLLMTAVMLFSAVSCSSNRYAIKIGDRTISEKLYKATAITMKSQFLSENGLEESDDLWSKYIDSTYSSTTQEYVDAMIQSRIITNALYTIHFDELGLSLDTETEDAIEKEITAYQNKFGSREKFESALGKQGFTYDDFCNQYYDEAKKKAVILHYFGPDSTENPTDREEMKKYYDEYYTRVKHVFLSTKDDETNDFTIPEKKKVGEKAQQIYDRALAGEDFDKLIDEYGEDPGMASSPDGYIFSQDESSYTKAFHNAAFEMKIGEIRLIQSNLGYHIMKRYPIMENGKTDTDTEFSLIENMMSNEIADIVDGLKERIGVEYNNTVLKNLSVTNLPAQTTESTQTEE